MTQILVTLNEDVATQSVRKAIELLRGVASTMVFQKKADSKTLRQQKYIKETLERAFDEVKRAERGEHKMMTDEEFLEQLKALRSLCSPSMTRARFPVCPPNTLSGLLPK